MAKHQVFSYRSSKELLEEASRLGVHLPFQESIAPLFEPLAIGGKKLPNRFAIQPMEGFDSEATGAPGTFTLRRYKRYSAGGSGLIWFEATCVCEAGKSNPRQMTLTKHSLPAIRELVEQTRETAIKNWKSDPYLVLQITHSGRYAKPSGKPLRKAACFNPYLDKTGEGLVYYSDRELEDLIEVFLEAIDLTIEAGFDGVDIKACHGYLIHELLSAFNREDSKFGGSLENRTRFLLDVLDGAKKRSSKIDLAVRLNAADGVPYPFGFGMSKNGSEEFDLTEPKMLIRELVRRGVKVLNVTAGIPYYCPQIVRPFNMPVKGASPPDEHPLQGVTRMLDITAEIQREFDAPPVVGSAYSWLRQFYPNVGAAALSRNMASVIGLGRMSFAYPDAPKDLMERGKLNPSKCCTGCSKCTELMKNGRKTGCVVRDGEIYAAEYKTLRDSA